MVDLIPVERAMLSALRRQRGAELCGPALNSDEVALQAAGALHVGLYHGGQLCGYGAYAAEDPRGRRTLLELYVMPGHRRMALSGLRQLIAWVPPHRWHVSSYDSFALSLACNAGLALNRTAALLFRFDGPLPESPAGRVYEIRQAGQNEYEPLRSLLSHDGFYTVGWERLPREIEAGQWQIMYSPGGTPVAAGFLEPVATTPGFAEIGMVVSPDWRHRGLGAAVASHLVRTAQSAALVPVAFCDYEHVASRRTLERAGFYCDGRLWSVTVHGIR